LITKLGIQEAMIVKNKLPRFRDALTFSALLLVDLPLGLKIPQAIIGQNPLLDHKGQKMKWVRQLVDGHRCTTQFGPPMLLSSSRYRYTP